MTDLAPYLRLHLRTNCFYEKRERPLNGKGAQERRVFQKDVSDLVTEPGNRVSKLFGGGFLTLQGDFKT